MRKPPLLHCSRWLRASHAVLVLALGFAGNVWADVDLPSIGGAGGSPFKVRCPEGQFLGGVRMAGSPRVNGVQAMCVGASGSPPLHKEGAFHGVLRSGYWYDYFCPLRFPAVNQMTISASDNVIGLAIFCGEVVGTPQSVPSMNARRVETPPAIFTQRCPAGFVAVGVTGRSDYFLDAFGLICADPKSFLKSLGRVGTPSTRTPPPLPICEAARIARAQNNSAAPGLEAQCAALAPIDLSDLHAKGAEIANGDPLAAELREQQRQGPARRGFEIGLAAADGDTARIRYLLNPAEQDGFDTAVAFSRDQKRQGITDLAAKGEALANQDPLALELREQLTQLAARQGFDIGMAIGETDTAPGPGKLKIRDSLRAAEQLGFDAALSFSLERNRNADLAARGAAIALQDRFVANARRAEPDAIHRLGFDIATGIFGDAKLGALGNTAKGPGSLKIRDGLSPFAQSGFNTSMAFHLSRDYGR